MSHLLRPGDLIRVHPKIVDGLQMLPVLWKTPIKGHRSLIPAGTPLLIIEIRQGEGNEICRVLTPRGTGWVSNMFLNDSGVWQ